MSSWMKTRPNGIHLIAKDAGLIHIVAFDSVSGLGVGQVLDDKATWTHWSASLCLGTSTRASDLVFKQP